MRAFNGTKLDRTAKKRLRHLQLLIDRSDRIKMAWFAERNHIQATGRADWADPFPIRVRPADHVLTPPPRAR